jgi:hypothetical protein
MKHPDVPGMENVRPLTALTLPEQRRALAAIDSAVAILREAGIPAIFCGGFVDELRQRVSASIEAP